MNIGWLLGEERDYRNYGGVVVVVEGKRFYIVQIHCIVLYCIGKPVKQALHEKRTHAQTPHQPTTIWQRGNANF